ncbi:MAG: hypothetical protein P4K86_02185 [Terracidiphilus sp.]|nr:hypothetical protein [Terracidiphilus sp.]
MSTASGIEIATGTSAQSLAAMSPGKTQSTGLATTDASSTAAATSFRSSWQSLLAALGADLDGASGTEAGTNAAAGSTGAVLVKTAGTESAASAGQSAVATLPGGKGNTQGTRTTASAYAAVTSYASGSVVSASAPAIKQETTAAQTDKNTAKAHAAESATGTHSASNTKLETASTGATEQISAAPEGAVQSMSAPVQQAVVVPSPATVTTPVSGTASFQASEDAPTMPFGLGDAVDGTASLTASKIVTAGSQTTNQAGESGWSGKISSVSTTMEESEAPQVGEAAHKGSATEGALSRSTLHDSAPVSDAASSLANNSSLRPDGAAMHSGTSEQPATAIEGSAYSGNETATTVKTGATSAQTPVQAAPDSQFLSLPSSNSQTPSAGTETLAATAVADTAKSQSSQPLDASSTGKKAGVTSAVRASDQTLSRSTQLTGTTDSMQHNGLSTAGQTGLAVQDGAGLVRDFAGGQGTTNTTGNTTGESAAAAASRDGSASRETFTALDAGSPTTPTWIHAGAQRAEAGFQDPALGWVGVRADSSGGSIHASLVAGSADAAQTLSGHLAGLNAYLADQHTPVGAVTMASTEDRSASYGMDQNTNQNMNQGTGQDGSRGQQAVPATSEPAFTPATSAVSAARTEVSASVGSLGGTHISLIA